MALTSFDRIAGREGLILARNEAVKGARRPAVLIKGLRELRRDLRAMPPATRKTFNFELRKSMADVAATASNMAPRKTGTLAGSIRPFAVSNTVGVRSRLPYGNVIHWGGSTGPGHMPGVPWSGSVFVRPSLFVTRAIEAREERIVDAVGDAIERAAVANGWK